MSTWQPIETAPKDHTRILIAFNYRNEERWITVAHYRADDKPLGCPTAWQKDGGQGFSSSPTHWMPLPALPEEDAA